MRHEMRLQTRSLKVGDELRKQTRTDPWLDVTQAAPAYTP